MSDDPDTVKMDVQPIFFTERDLSSEQSRKILLLVRGAVISAPNFFVNLFNPNLCVRLSSNSNSIVR